MTKSLTYVEVDCDYCSLTYGVAPCAAQLSLLSGSDPNVALFDGTNDYLTRGAGLTGAADGKQLTFSCWMRLTGGQLGGRLLSGMTTVGGGAANLGGNFSTTTADNTFNVFFRNSAAATVLDISGSIIPQDRWVHVLVSIDLTSTTKRHIYVNDVSDLALVTTYINDTIDLTLADWAVGAWADGTRKLNGQIAELWFHPTYIDFSIETNRRKFISSDHRPVALGATGQLPTGTAPLVYLGNPFGTFQTNLGTGGNFTVHGALTAGTFSTGTVKCFNTRFTCQDIAHFTDVGTTMRFAVNAEYLPREIDCIPSISDVKFTPAIVSLGEDLGTRASLTVEFKDHKHPDTGDGFDKYVTERTYNPYEQGTFWGRFRTRHPFLQARSIRLIRGLLGDALAAMENRHYVIESTEGPSYDGFFTVSAKDVLKLADGDRSQAPPLSGGSLLAAVTATQTYGTLTPAGIGESEYPISGYLNLSEEIVAYNRPLSATFLCHCESAGSPDVFVDDAGHAITTVGNTFKDTAQFVFGTKSAKFDGTGDYLQLPGGTDFTFGLGNWRISARVRMNSLAAPFYYVIDFRAASGDLAPWIRITQNGAVAYGTTTNTRVTSVNGVITTGVWYLIEVTMVDGTARLFLDGVSQGTPFVGTDNLICGASRPRWGAAFDATSSMNGWMDEMFILKGNPPGASANYTPPAAAYTLTRGDDIDITARGQFNTTAVAHSAGDKAQVCVSYSGQDPSDIIYDLLVNYAAVPASYINLSDWHAETAAFFGSLFTALIAEPTSVNQLLSEIMDLGFALWWDDKAQLIRFQVLRQIATTAATYTDDDRIENSLKIKEQPEKRLSQVWTYFAKISPLKNQDQIDNYASVAKTTDATAETNYGTPAIRKRFTRWIPLGGAAVAQASNDVLLSRYVDPPRRFNFDLPRLYDAMQDPTLGGGYQLEAWCLQDETGARATVPIQFTKLNPNADRFEIEAEEMLATPTVANPNDRVIVIDANALNLNMRTLHDSLYPAPVSGNTVTLIINGGITIGSSSILTPALDVGTWPAGVTLAIQGSGRIQGHGGDGGSQVGHSNTAGQNGGPALYTRNAIAINMSSGAEIWSGGGGGGLWVITGVAYGGGGGAGTIPGAGGSTPTAPGSPGTATAGGAGGGFGAAGGGPGLDGVNGNTTGNGVKGAAIDGISFCTVSSPAPDIRGTQIN